MYSLFRLILKMYIFESPKSIKALIRALIDFGDSKIYIFNINLNNEYICLSYRSGLPNHNGTKIFKIGQKLTEIWPKNGILYVCTLKKSIFRPYSMSEMSQKQNKISIRY